MRLCKARTKAGKPCPSPAVTGKRFCTMHSGRARELGRKGGLRRALPGVAVAYRQAWQRAFGPRLMASSLLAHWAMRPAAVAGILPAVRRFPSILTWGARWSGKSKLLADEFLRQKAVSP